MLKQDNTTLLLITFLSTLRIQCGGDELHHNFFFKKNLNIGVGEFLGQEQKITQPPRKWIDGK